MDKARSIWPLLGSSASSDARLSSFSPAPSLCWSFVWPGMWAGALEADLGTSLPHPHVCTCARTHTRKRWLEAGQHVRALCQLNVMESPLFLMPRFRFRIRLFPNTIILLRQIPSELIPFTHVMSSAKHEVIFVVDVLSIFMANSQKELTIYFSIHRIHTDTIIIIGLESCVS